MALNTFADAVDGAKVSYPEISAAQGLIYCKQIWRRIINAAQIEAQEETFSSLVSGTREYTKDTTTQPVDVVRDAYYITSATVAKKLIPVSVDWLDKYAQADWRTTTDTSTPVYYYIEAKDDGTVKLGLHPIPDTTTSAGYPKVTLYGSSYRVVTTATDVPGIIPDIRVLINGIKMLHAEDKDPARLPLWTELFESYLHLTLAHINSMQEDSDVPKLEYSWMENPVVQ